MPPAQSCSLLPLAATVRVGMWVCVREPTSRPGAVCVRACAHLAFVLYKPRDAMCLCTLWLCVHVCKRGCGCGTQAAVCSFCLLDWALVLRATGVGLRRGCWLAEVAPASCLGQAVTLTIPFHGADETRPFPYVNKGSTALCPAPLCSTTHKSPWSPPERHPQPVLWVQGARLLVRQDTGVGAPMWVAELRDGERGPRGMPCMVVP